MTYSTLENTKFDTNKQKHTWCWADPPPPPHTSPSLNHLSLQCRAQSKKRREKRRKAVKSIKGHYVCVQLDARVERVGADIVEDESCIQWQTTYRGAAGRMVGVFVCVNTGNLNGKICLWAKRLLHLGTRCPRGWLGVYTTRPVHA